MQKLCVRVCVCLNYAQKLCMCLSLIQGFLIPFVLFLLPINIDESYLKKICILKISLKINFQTLIHS